MKEFSPITIKAISNSLQKIFTRNFLLPSECRKILEKDAQISAGRWPAYRYLNLPGYVHINEIARHFGISVETVKELNPALLPPVIDGEKHIPKGYSL